jgi:phosphoribosylaminoimidazole-succinocarboxamide synthase
MIVRRAKRIDFECVVRGYLSGSAWKEYKETGKVSGIALPKGLVESQKLPEPIFTPATKAETGHDENVSYAKMSRAIGKKLAEQVRDASLQLYTFAAEMAEKRGLILADTKFEFGLVGDRLILIDEALTPDSSRYWDRARWQPGSTPPSFDKQYVRDWLDRSGWDKKEPGPELPDDVVARTRELYLTAYRQVTGRDLFYREPAGRW